MRIATLLICTIAMSSMAIEQDSSGQSKPSVDSAIDKLSEKLQELQPPKWSYSELASISDLIVVAKVISNTEIKKENEAAGEFAKDTTKLLSNRLQVLSVLKGQAADRIDVLTLQWKPDVLILVNSDFAKLRSKLTLPADVPIVMDGDIVEYGTTTSQKQTYTIQPEYLLYLCRIESDQYAPVTGQRDSGLSVRLLND